MTIALRSTLVVGFFLGACGGSNGAPPAAKTPEPVMESTPARTVLPVPAGQGSSDGVTCEQARDAHPDELSIGAKGGQSDLRASDFAAVLNNGAYLEPCAVPSSSKLRICAAVQNGRAIGVTVAAEPAASEIEICIAKAVRTLTFPSNAKLDVVNVQF
jgi:hypothetical protein